MFLAVTDNIIVILIPHQEIRGEVVSFAVIVRNFTAMLVVMEIPERNLLSVVDRSIDVIHQVVDLLIERLHAFRDIQIAF